MLSIIVAMDKNNLIGNNNSLPWHLPADLQYFKKITTGKAIIMGRKTFESIGKALPNRTNIILTRDKNYNNSSCEIIHSIEQIKNYKNAFIIGGSNVYKQTIDMVDKLYVTKITGEFKGDTYFPTIDTKIWQLTTQNINQADTKNIFAYNFTTFEKI